MILLPILFRVGSGIGVSRHRRQIIQGWQFGMILGPTFAVAKRFYYNLLELLVLPLLDTWTAQNTWWSPCSLVSLCFCLLRFSFFCSLSFCRMDFSVWTVEVSFDGISVSVWCW